MAAREIARYLARTANLGLALVEGTNLFWRPFGPNDPDIAVAVLDVEGEPDERAGSAGAAAVLEHPRCLILVRGARAAGLDPVFELAERIYGALRRIGDDGHDLLDGTSYLDAAADSPPYYEGDDQNGRPRYAFEYALTRVARDGEAA